jgi:hypothetical protein
MQPSAGGAPVVLYRPERERFEFGDLIKVKAGKEAKLNDSALARRKGGQPVQGFIQRQELDGFLGSERVQVVERHLFSAAAALIRRFAAGPLNQNPPHRNGGHRHEVARPCQLIRFCPTSRK